MTFDIGAKVLTRDGKKVGSLERVVMEPKTGEVTHLVLHKGSILTRDVVVPVSAARRVGSQLMRLDLTASELEEMPDFVETDYVLPQHASSTGPYVPGSVLWPTAYAYAPTVVAEEKHVPQDAVDITEGTEVVCPDGKVGVVDEVVVSDKGEVTGLVLKKGVFGHRDGVIPITWVEHADAKAIRLNRLRKEVEEYLRFEDIRG